jgi:Acyclic terpene utilisation family protein AtuA
MSKPIRIGGASGFWGDSAIALPQLLREPLDFVSFDYLAEITMSILARARARDPEGGYVPEFVDLIARHAPELVRRGIRVLANAGGVNPLACARALEARLAEQGVDLKVGVVLGDDLMGMAESLREQGLSEMFSGDKFPDKPVSMNAYLGAEPVARLLDQGADVVITGRCVDSALTLGACIHAFGWTREALDERAGGSLAGHIIECGAQASGGLHTDWEKTGDWADIGYPIVEIEADGSFTVSKPEGTGGLVSFGTVAEQMLYEIGDPAAYVLPDVVCDFRSVKIAETGADCVRVTGAKGRMPTSTYKVSSTWMDGYRVGAMYTVTGIDAVAKSRKIAGAVLDRCSAMLAGRGLEPYTETSVEVIGSESPYGAFARGESCREVVLKIAAKHPVPAALELLVREFTSAGTSMAPGFTGMGGNRPKVTPVVRLFSMLVPKTLVPVEIVMGTAREVLPEPADSAGADDREALAPTESSVELVDPVEVPLIALAFARSGDKGNNANIGVIARDAALLPYIRSALTEERVAQLFAHYAPRKVERFDLPGTNALNFLVHDVLGGGGIASLRNDPQGKAFGQILLDQMVAVPRDLAGLA